MRLYIGLLSGLLGRSLRGRRDLLLENLVLRQQLAVYSRQPRRVRLRQEDRIFWSVVARAWSPWRSRLRLVQPETVVRWHRTVWRRYWTWKSRRRGPGRPRIDPELRELILRLARENPRWGSVRIVGELRALGFSVSARTVSRYRRLAGRRPPSQSWQTFLHNHAPSIWAVDLLTVQTLALRTFYVVVFIAHDRRRIVHINVTHHPTAAWIWRQLIEATPWGGQPRYLIRDRDRCYGANFVAKASRIGIGTLRRECLDHMIILNERHLRRVLHEYVGHYNGFRPHRTLGLDSPEGRPPQMKPRRARVRGRPVLGGLHHEYQWAA